MSLDDFDDAIAALQRSGMPFIVAIKRKENQTQDEAIWRVQGEVNRPEEWFQAHAAIYDYVQDSTS